MLIVSRIDFHRDAPSESTEHQRQESYRIEVRQRIQRYPSLCSRCRITQAIGHKCVTELMERQADDDSRQSNQHIEEIGLRIGQTVLSDVGQTLGHAALTEQVAQHQHTQQGGGVGDQQDHENGHGDGEDDLLRLGHGAQLGHLDLAHLLGGQGLHQRRLDHGDQSHVGVSRDGDGGQQLNSQLRRSQDGGGAVSAADDADICSLLSGQERKDEQRRQNYYR